MCARFTLTKSPWLTARALGTTSVERALRTRYNVAPTQPVTALLNDAGHTVEDVRWGLVPPHAESPAALKLSTFNARIETIAKAPTYRDAFRTRRCAIFADGFYEWRGDADGGKTPMYITRTDGAPFLFAGLWEVWRGGTDEATVTSATIVTQPANDFMATIHSRMPVVLDLERARVWVTPGDADAAALLDLLTPSPPEIWTAHPVAPRVGNARFDDAALIARVADTGATNPSLFDMPARSV
jgi:putative SOS response-associated peptidase YedK